MLIVWSPMVKDVLGAFCVRDIAGGGAHAAAKEGEGSKAEAALATRRAAEHAQFEVSGNVERSAG
jgi:hypothetical protein